MSDEPDRTIPSWWGSLAPFWWDRSPAKKRSSQRTAEDLANLREAGSREPILVDYNEAARLLGTTVSALKTRVSRGDLKLTAAMITSGRTVRFNVDKLNEKFTPRRRQ